MKYLWIPLLAAVALILFLLLRKPKAARADQQPALDPEGEGFRLGGGGAAGFQPGDVSGLTLPMTGWPPPVIVQPKLTYQQVVQRRLGEPVKKIGSVLFKPKPGSAVVTTPAGGTATIGVNPNKPTFT